MLLFAFIACTNPPPPDCPEADCPAAALEVEAWEAELLQPMLEDIREGVILYGEQFGICQGRSKCDTFLGAEPDLLPPGAYMVRAEVQAPSVGEDWQVRFEVTCEKSDSEARLHEKIYAVKYTGKTRGFRLQPLWTIQSPHPGGARDCHYTLTPLRGDTPIGDPWTGRYRTPAEE